MRPAATLLVVRDGASGVEVLMGTRPQSARFAPGALVFPGGVVDEADGGERASSLAAGVRDPWRMAAVRETFEETGVPVAVDAGVPPSGSDFFDWLSAVGARVRLESLAYLSTWVTPAFLPRRYDTRFFLAEYRGTADAKDSDELTDVAWMSPHRTLAAWRRGQTTAVSPTLAHLEWLAEFDSVCHVTAGTKEGHHFDLIDQAAVEGVQPPGLESSL